MKLGYTEFSFGYAFTENLIRSSSSGPSSAPVFPNLVQEAQLGYDVHIDMPSQPLFFQYKLPEKMVRNNVKEVSVHHLPGFYPPFFRMPLMRRDSSDQHKLLIDLENRFPGAVYYATPEMPSPHEFNSAYAAANVHRQSVLFSPSAIGPLPDNKDHVVSYRQSESFGWFCSQPLEIPAVRFNGLVDKIENRFEDEEFRDLESAAENTWDRLAELVPQNLKDLEDVFRDRIETRMTSIPDRRPLDERTRNVTIKILVAREIARIGLGLEMVVGQRRS